MAEKSTFSSILHQLCMNALPILLAQLASVGMMMVDTTVLGHVSAADLAAVAIGGGIYVAVLFALVGVLQAISPLVAHFHGAKQDDEMIKTLQQGFYLAICLSLPGILLLAFPDWILSSVPMDAIVADKTRSYLQVLAAGLPFALFYRTFYAFCTALGRSYVLMCFGIAGLCLHALLAWGLALEGWIGSPLGAVGCALSNITLSLLVCISAAAYLHYGKWGRQYRLFQNWSAPDFSRWRELLRIGLPMGFSNFVEISAFTLVALFLAPLGATVVAGHRIVANLAAFSYMLPLSIGIAVMAAVAQSLGAGNVPLARRITYIGLSIATIASVLVGLLIWYFAVPVLSFYTNDPAVLAISVGLIIYMAAYQFFDALQTVAGHVLRAFRITFVPMLIQSFCFWGAGLLGGAFLCYEGWPSLTEPLGAIGFWQASALSLVLASIFLLFLMQRVLQQRLKEIVG